MENQTKLGIRQNYSLSLLGKYIIFIFRRSILRRLEKQKRTGRLLNNYKFTKKQIMEFYEDGYLKIHFKLIVKLLKPQMINFYNLNK